MSTTESALGETFQIVGGIYRGPCLQNCNTLPQEAKPFVVACIGPGVEIVALSFISLFFGYDNLIFDMGSGDLIKAGRGEGGGWGKPPRHMNAPIVAPSYIHYITQNIGHTLTSRSD